MPFVVTKTSHHGISNPIVARLSVQPPDLMGPFFVDVETKEQVLATLRDVVQHNLISCYDLWLDISNREEEIISKVENEGITSQSEGNVATIETIESLELKSHTFLYCAKSALRGLKSMILEFYVSSKGKREKLEDGDFEKLKQWANGKFGASSEFAQMIESECDRWIAEVYAKRNAVEHPNGKSGILDVENFTVVQELETKSWKGVLPTWRRNQDPSSLITRDMGIIIENILTFSEDALALCLQESDTGGLPIIFREIPLGDRNPKCPVRLHVEIDRNR